MKRTVILLLALMCLSLCACSRTEPQQTEAEPPVTVCTHDYEVTESVESSCAEFGAIRHVCRICGHSFAIQLQKKPHDFLTASCTAPKTCTACGAVEGESEPHNWQAGTCADPKVCIDCGYADGSLLDHTYERSKCVYCRAAEFEILPELQAYYEKNNDLVGWITVPGTVIDYPVMQTPDSKDYYLKRDFDHNWSAYGTIYVREACDVNKPSDNVVLYGHHMADGSMFAQLETRYKYKSFWEEHQYLTFNTLHERHTYQIIAVFRTSANPGQGFSYHIFNEAKSEAEFDAFMAKVKELASYETGLTAQYGDKLLTLSTCEYTLDNGRFVVIAKRID